MPRPQHGHRDGGQPVGVHRLEDALHRRVEKVRLGAEPNPDPLGRSRDEDHPLIGRQLGKEDRLPDTVAIVDPTLRPGDALRGKTLEFRPDML